MQKNMGTLDKTLRLIVAAIAVGLGASGTLALVAYVVAAVFVVTSLVSFCPLYRLIGLRTCANC